MSDHHDAHPAPAEAHDPVATAEAPKNGHSTERNIDVERKKIQELLDTTIGPAAARKLKLNADDNSKLERSAALVFAREHEEQEAINALLRAQNENERIKAIQEQLRATQKKIQAQTRFNTIANTVNNRVLPERDDTPHSALRSGIREYVVPVAGSLGIGASLIANAIGFGKASSFFLGTLGVLGYSGGFLGGLAAGAWIGGKIENALRYKLGSFDENATVGKTIGSLVSASGMALMIPGSVPSAIIGAGMYGMYKSYQWFRKQRFRSTPAYRNAEYLRSLTDEDLTTLGKPAEMTANIVGTNLVLTLEEKGETVDVSAATTNHDIDDLIQEGIHRLEGEVHDEHNEHNEKQYRTLLKGWTVPKDVRLDFSHAYDHQIRCIYKTNPSETIHCDAFPDDADAFKNMFDAEVQAMIQRFDSADNTFKAKKFTALLKDLKLPDGVELVLVDTAHTANRQVMLSYKGTTHPATVAAGGTQTYIECREYGDDAIPTMLQNQAEAFKRREDERGLTAGIKFTKLLKGIISIPGMVLSYAKTGQRKLDANYRGNGDEEIDCTNIHDEHVAEYVNQKLDAIRHRIDEERQTRFETAFATLTPDDLNEIEYEMVGTNQRTVKFKLGGMERIVNCMSVDDTAVVSRLQQEIRALRTLVVQKREREILQWATEYPSSPRFTVRIDSADRMRVLLNRTPVTGVLPPATASSDIPINATSILSREALHNEITREARSAGWIT